MTTVCHIPNLLALVAMGAVIALLPPPAGAAAPRPPAWLPRYDLDIRLDTACRSAKVKQTIRWTNPASLETSDLLLHVYPRYQPSKDDLMILERTLESFRIDPRTGIDRQGRRIKFSSVRSGDVDLEHCFEGQTGTLLRIRLPQPVKSGQTVEVKLAYDLDIPPAQSRFGQYKGVTTLLNWYPIVAYYGPKGWDAPPYIAWHQPFLNEAGIYNVKLSLPAGEMVASSGAVIARQELADGWQQLSLVANGVRDFAIVASKRFEVMHGESDGVKINVLALPEHRFYARQMLQTAVECIAQYNQWFGPYPYPEFTISEAYFGWNGNETGGMVLIDERVFAAPHYGHLYVEHLVSHEICHQWWFNAVGTDGYRESWMDEGLVSYLTELRIRRKHGANAKLLGFPPPMQWFPNVSYHSLQHAGYPLYLGRGGKGKPLADLTEIGHVHNLFFLAYDRGNKIVGMLHQRLGDDLFFELLHRVFAKYCFRILFVEDFQREVETLTEASWQPFFDDWLRSNKIADWKIDSVDVAREEKSDGWRTVVKIRQIREIDEPIELGYQTERNGSVCGRVLVSPGAREYSIDGFAVRDLGGHCWQVSFASAQRPWQIVLDPDKNILDANLNNNRWRCEIPVRLTPLYTPLDEVPLAHPLDRPSFVMGPNVDQEARFGLRAALIQANEYRISSFLAYSSDDARFVAGIDSEVFNVPVPNWSIGARLERTISTGLFDDPLYQGKFFLRWTQAYTTSFIYPNLAYAETYLRLGDNFWPDPDFRLPPPGVEDYRQIRAVGVAYHLDTQMPYWNPEQGMRLDVAYELGFHALNAGESYHRTWGQVSAVHRLPDWIGPLSETRIAGRLAGGIGAPDNGEHFRFGGAFRFRGQRSEDTEGSEFWLASAEWRFPLLTSLNTPVLDNTFNCKSLYAAVFYDVGESHLFELSQGVDHSLGAGMYFHVSLLSFLETLTVRLEYAHSLRSQSNVAWVGWWHAF